MGSIHDIHASVQIISDNGHQAGASAVCAVWLVSTSGTERLCVLLTASNSHWCIAHSYVAYPVGC